MVEMRELGASAKEEGAADADAFLLDYIAKQQWKSNQKYSTRKEDDDGESEDDYEQDEDELDKVDLFEHKYNFRFEELQGEDGTDGGSRSNVIGMGLQSLQVTSPHLCAYVYIPNWLSMRLLHASVIIRRSLDILLFRFDIGGN